MPRRLTTSDFISKARKIHGKTYDYFDVEYKKSHSKIKIFCKECNKSFLQTPNSHLNGNGCPTCAINSTRLTTKSFIQKAKKIHGTKYDYSKVAYKRSVQDVIICCKECGNEFLQEPRRHLCGDGCWICARKSKSLSLDDFIHRSIKIHGNRYNYSSVKYLNTYTLVEIKCTKCGRSFDQTPGSHLEGCGCPHCFHFISSGETEFLDIINVPKKNRQKKIGKYKVDGIVGENIFEFNGDYWHGNPKKFDKTAVNECSRMTFGEMYDKMIEKFNFLVSKGFSVHYIWESDFNQWKKSKVKKELPIIHFTCIDQSTAANHSPQA